MLSFKYFLHRQVYILLKCASFHLKSCKINVLPNFFNIVSNLCTSTFISTKFAKWKWNKNFSSEVSCANGKGRFKSIVQWKPNTCDEILQPIPLKYQPTKSRTNSTELASNQMTEALQMRSGNFLAGFGTGFSVCQSTQSILIFSLVSWKIRPIGGGGKLRIQMEI